jgi:hypothetical protein
MNAADAYLLGRSSVVYRIGGCPFAEGSALAAHWFDGRYDADMDFCQAVRS